MSKYIKISMESGDGGKLYQRTTFEQFYGDDGTLQITEQMKVFQGVAGAVMQPMIDAGNDKLKELAGK
jgi:hypothetical protein